MKIIISLAVLLSLCRFCFAQDDLKASMTNSKSAITVLLESSLEPSNPKLPGNYKMGAVTLKGFHRYTANTDTHEYFGYDIQVQAIPQQPGYFRISFGDLSLTPQDLSLPNPSSWKKLPAPLSPAPEIMKGSDAVAVNVFVNPASGQRVVDYIRLKTSECDSNNPADQQTCLLMAKLDVMAHVHLLLRTRDAETAAAIKQSQQTWEIYKNEACSALSPAPKRFQCELSLTRSRSLDLANIY